MGTGTSSSIGLKPIGVRVSTLLLLFAQMAPALSYVNTQLKEFSHPEPIKKQIYQAAKVEYYQEPKLDPGDALLRSAPPYKLLATSLSAIEERERKEKATNILIAAAFEHNEQLASARSKLKRNQFTKLGARMINQLANFADNSEAQQYIRNNLGEITKQFNTYSQSYFKSSRDGEWLAEIEKARAYLIYNCSEAALIEVDKLYLGDKNETITNTGF